MIVRKKKTEMLSMADQQYRYGSYTAAAFRQNLPRNYYAFCGIAAEQTGPEEFAVYDADVPAGPAAEEYLKEAGQVYGRCCQDSAISFEGIYDAIFAVRRRYLTTAHRFADIGSESGGIDQRAKFAQLLQQHQNVILLLTKQYLSRLPAILQRLAGREVFAIVKQHPAAMLCTASEISEAAAGREISFLSDPTAGEFVDFRQVLCPADSFLAAYGEELLLEIKDLSVDAVLTTGNAQLSSKVLLNRFEKQQESIIYIHHGWNLIPANPIVRPSRLSYHHLDLLQKEFGDRIYAMQPADLYRLKPELFLDYYAESPRPATDFTAQAADIEGFWQQRRQYLADLLNRQPQFQFAEYYFAEDGTLRNDYRVDPVQKQLAVLVDFLRVKNSRSAEVIRQGAPSRSPRAILYERNPDLAVIVNFLFFMTPRLRQCYNRQRRSRQPEQLPDENFFLDYLKEGQTEYFPLYHKYGICSLAGEGLKLTSFQLQAGTVFLDQLAIAWQPQDVNPLQPADIAVYTPLYCEEDSAGQVNWQATVTVGQGRMNLIFVANHLICARHGEVLLPSVGVVVSLSEAKAAALGLDQLLHPVKDGYALYQGSWHLQLANPSSLSDRQWEKVQWAYGGALCLMENGKADFRQHFHTDGWLRQLSEQTQESQIQKDERHPRTALGIAGDGSLCIFVFSGRSNASRGADYEEMLTAIHRIEPTIQTVINADGGASSVLAVYEKGNFTELSVPCTSQETPAGKIRDINSMLVIE